MCRLKALSYEFVLSLKAVNREASFKVASRRMEGLVAVVKGGEMKNEVDVEQCGRDHIASLGARSK